MKLLVIAFLTISSSLHLFAQNAVITVSNPASFDRPCETIEISWNKIKKMMRAAKSNAPSVFENGKQLVSQVIDTDGNGKPDILIFQSAFRRGEKKRFIVKTVSARQEVPTVTDAKYILPRKDVAWENDRIAFRIYGGPLAGDVRNGLDVWMKRVRYRIIDTWYGGDSLKGSKRISYHIDHGEGADFFNVGRSLGAGACSPWDDGMLDQAGLFSAYRIIATGPIRAMFSVVYEKDSLGKQVYREEKIYMLDAGENLNRIAVWYSGFQKKGAIAVAAGLVKRKGVTRFVDEQHGWVSLWGLTTEDTANGSLGTGIVMPRSTFNTLKEDSVQYYLIGRTTPDKRLTYYAGAGWTRSGDFINVDDWNSYLTLFAKRIVSPLRISIAPGKK